MTAVDLTQIALWAVASICLSLLVSIIVLVVDIATSPTPQARVVEDYSPATGPILLGVLHGASTSIQMPDGRAYVTAAFAEHDVSQTKPTISTPLSRMITSLAPIIVTSPPSMRGLRPVEDIPAVRHPTCGCCLDGQTPLISGVPCAWCGTVSVRS